MKIYYVLLLGLIAIIFIITFNINISKVKGNSMLPSFHSNDLILHYKHGIVKKGEEIIFTITNKTYIKRCVGIPGDNVVIKNKELYVNDTSYYPQENSFIEEFLFENKDKFFENGSYRIPQRGDTLRKKDKIYDNIIQFEHAKNMNYHIVQYNYYFVLGDNYFKSKDSRMFGLVSSKQIEANNVFRIF
jgi:signal peptidase I